ncbi:MAG: recombinase family protein [Robinsoniella sp.]|nr:recombinase family protein [Robinsoniella sp.]
MDLATAIYARQSMDKKDSISIETQIEICHREVISGEKIVIYHDRGFSGKNTNRPEFIRMMEEIQAGRIRRVIVYKLDRISRSVLDFARMMEEFGEHKVEFVSCTEKFDTSTAMGRAMLNIAVVFAQLERETIQARVTDAYYSRSHKGYYMGGRVPCGFQLENTVIDGIHTSKFVPDPDGVELVRRIYEEYAKPEGTLGGTMRALMEAGYQPSPGKAPLSTARISEMIRNPVYVKADIEVYHFFASQGARIVNPVEDFIGTNGLFLYKGMDGDRKKRKQYDLKDREVVVAPHEGIIDSDIWLVCRRKIMKNRKLAMIRKGKRSWLTGKVKCKKCGYAYQVIQYNRGETVKRYFRCSGARYSIKCTGAGTTIYADELEDYLLSEIKKELEKLGDLSDEWEKRTEPACNRDQIRMAQIDREINTLLEKLLFANATLMRYINKQVVALDLEKQELQRKMAGSETSEAASTKYKMTDFLRKWEELALIDKQRIADILIDRIEIGDREIQIFWNL